MPEYIVKEQALEAILSAIDLTGEQWAQVWNKIKQTPSADVAPVVHGKWKFVAGPDEDNNVQVMCDNCGAGDVQALDVIVPYCWKCGARMDGGE